MQCSYCTAVAAFADGPAAAGGGAAAPCPLHVPQQDRVSTFSGLDESGRGSKES